MHAVYPVLVTGRTPAGNQMPSTLCLRPVLAKGGGLEGGSGPARVLRNVRTRKGEAPVRPSNAGPRKTLRPYGSSASPGRCWICQPRKETELLPYRNKQKCLCMRTRSHPSGSSARFGSAAPRVLHGALDVPKRDVGHTHGCRRRRTLAVAHPLNAIADGIPAFGP